MTKKDYILSNEAIAGHDYYRIQIHGIENGFAYISRLYQATYCGATKVSFHKVKINQYADGEKYIRVSERTFDGRRKELILNFNNFIFKSSGYGVYTPSCAELKAIC